jgi:hypothetical protein
VLGNAQAVQSSDAQGMERRVVLHGNWYGSSSPGGRGEVPHWPKAPRDRSESKCVRGIRCVCPARGGNSARLVDDDVLSCEEVVLDGSVRAAEDGREDANGIWRGWKLWCPVQKLSRGG